MPINKAMNYRWVVFSCLIAVYILVFFHRMSLGTLQDEIMSRFAMSAASFATLGAMYFYAYLIMQLPTGIMADTLGPRIVVAVGGLVTTTGTLMFALSHTVVGVCAGRFLIGLGVSVVYVSIVKIISQWFKEGEFASMLGLTGFFGNLAGVLAGAPLALLVMAFSFQATFLFLSGLSLALAVTTYILVRNKPQDMGYPAIASPEETGDLTVGSGRISLKEGLSSVCKSIETWRMFIIMTTYYASYISFAGIWGVSYIRTVYNMDNVTAAKYITLFSLGMALGYLVIGFISDKLKSRKAPLLFFGGLINILWFVMFYFNGAHLSPPLLAIVCIGIGFSTSVYSLTLAICKEVNDPRYLGMAISFINLGSFLGGAIVPILVGIILDNYSGILTGVDLFRRGFLICLVLNGIGLATTFLVKETGCRNTYFNRQVSSSM